MADLKLRPLPQPHIPLVGPINEQAAQAFYEYWKDADRILRAVAKFVNEDEPYVPDFATIEDVWAASAGNKLLTAELLATAAEPVPIEDGSSPVFDWAEGINRTWEMAANREVPNPINGQPGTWRSIIVKGSSSTEREITFDDQYGGDLPEIDDVTNAKWYELIIRCETTDHYLVSYRDASPP